MIPHLGHTELIVVVAAASVYVFIGQSVIMKTRKQSPLGLREDLLLGVCLKLTFASLDALKPPVISVSVDGTSTILIPSATRSTAADSAGFPECTALLARVHIASSDV